MRVPKKQLLKTWFRKLCKKFYRPGKEYLHQPYLLLKDQNYQQMRIFIPSCVTIRKKELKTTNNWLEISFTKMIQRKT